MGGRNFFLHMPSPHTAYGRADFPDGNFGQISSCCKSIFQKLMTPLYQIIFLITSETEIFIFITNVEAIPRKRKLLKKIHSYKKKKVLREGNNTT